MVNKKILIFLGIILIIPLIGFSVGMGIKYKFDSELQQAFAEKIKTTDKKTLPQEQAEFFTAVSEHMDRVTADLMCTMNPSDAFCQTNSNITLLIKGSILAALVSLGLIIFIWLIGKFANTNRQIVLYVFKPALYFSLLTIVFLVLINSAIAMGAIYYGELVFIGRIHVFIILGIGIGAIIGILALIPKIFGIVKKAEIFVIGKIISKQDASDLWNLVGKISKKVGSLMPDHIVVGLDPNFFVTEASVTCLDRNLEGRTLYFSLTLSHIMTIDEVSAVLGHELSHFKGKDTVFSQKFYPIYRGTSDSINSLSAQIDNGGSGGLALLPAIAILSYFLNQFSVVENRISRNRELIADKYGAAVTNPKVFSSALAKIHAFAPYWKPMNEAFVNALKEGKFFVNACITYSEVIRDCAKTEILTDLPKHIMIHPTDSHPTLAIRLINLKINIDDIKEEILSVHPSNSAVTLIPDPDEMEKDISAAYQLILAKRLGIDI